MEGKASCNAIAGEASKLLVFPRYGLSSMLLYSDVVLGNVKHDLNPSLPSHPPPPQTSSYPLPNSRPSAVAALH